MSTTNNWKVYIKDHEKNIAKFLLISDIETIGVVRRNMAGNSTMCEIYKWKVNGKAYIDHRFDGDYISR